MFTSERIIIHSLASPWLLLFLYLFPRLNNKTFWVIWGKDLYFYKHLDKKYFYHDIYEFFRKKVFKKIKFIVPIFKGDYKLAKRWYDVKAKMIECNMLYPYAIKFNNNPIQTSCKKRKHNIIIGNSASKTNLHIEIFKDLSKHLNYINRVYCPVSYGSNSKHIQKITKAGYKLFGNKFFPLSDFLSLDKYSKLMQEIDIACYNHNRQEGLGNILTFMNIGKTIYMKPNISSSIFFKNNNIEILDINTLKTSNFIQLSNTTLNSNKKRMRYLFNNEKSFNIWQKIFNLDLQ